MAKYTITMTTDDNYIIPTKVAIYSMIKAGNVNNNYEIHILCTSDLTSSGRKFLSELQKKFSNIDIIYNEVETSLLKNVSTHAYIPVASYYRLFISRFIDDDKCLFIDGDVIVLDDIAKLFLYDLDDNYIAAVKDCAVQNKKVGFENHEIRLGIKSLDDYVNAGVMIFNLKKIRDDRLDSVFTDKIKDGYKFMDQDILNKFCFGKIMHLPLRYNLFSEYYQRVMVMDDPDYSKNEMIDAQENPAIIHYPWQYKPWNTRRLYANKLWWKYAQEILGDCDIKNLEAKAVEFENLSDISYIYESIKDRNKVVIFGFSDYSKWLYERLINKFSNKEYVFCDNDEKKQGCIYKETCVKSAKDLLKSGHKYCWIIASQNAYLPIRNQLVFFGVSEEDIVRYYHKDSSYYDGLSEEFIDYEKLIIG